MLHLVAWVAVCFGVAWLLRERPWLGMGFALVLWTLVPAVAGHKLTGQTGGALGVDPATLLILAVAVVAFMRSPGPMLERLSEHALAAIALCAFVAASVVTSILLHANGMKLLLDMIVAPILLFWVVITFARNNPRALDVLRALVVWSVSLQCVLAIVERVQGHLLLYGSDYARLAWFDPATFTRWMGTTDSHLVLAFAICIAAPLTVGVRRPVLRVSLLAVQVVGAVITQSRAVTAVLAVVLVYFLVRGRMSALGRLLTVTLAAGAAFLLVRSDLTEGIRSRLSNDHGSAAGRGSALELFYSHAQSYLFAGNGLMSSYDVAVAGGLKGSFESSFFMYAVDVGLLASIAYFGTMFALVVRNTPGNRVKGAPLAAFMGLVIVQTFSALGFSNLSGAFLWAAIALVVAGSRSSSQTAITRRPSPLRASRNRSAARTQPPSERTPTRRAPISPGV